jgi:hypothetical protein
MKLLLLRSLCVLLTVGLPPVFAQPHDQSSVGLSREDLRPWFLAFLEGFRFGLGITLPFSPRSYTG